MTVNDFINDLVKLLTDEGTEARMAAEDIAADLLIWIEQVPWASAELERRKAQVGQQLLRLRGAKPQNVDTRKATIWLPPEFIRLCQRDQVEPDLVLRGFIGDLCGIMNWSNNPRADGYGSNGSDERRMAEEYYERVGYPWFHREP